MTASTGMLVLAGTDPATVGGFTLIDRAARLGRRIGLDPIVAAPPGSRLFTRCRNDQPVVVVAPDVLFEPALLASLIASGERHQ